MSGRELCNWTVRLLPVAAALCVAVSGQAIAQRTTSVEVADCYDRAQELLEQDQSHQALAVVRACLDKEGRTPGERAVLLRFAAQLEVEADNLPQAIKDIEASFATGALTELEIRENHYFIGRLHLLIKPPNRAKAIEHLRRFIAMTKEPVADAHFALAHALAGAGRCGEAIPQLRKAIEFARDPEEAHFRLLLYCHVQLDQYREAVPLIERMLKMFPVRDEYLGQLLVGYLKMKREKDAFTVHAYRYELGFLDKEAELIGIADLHVSFGYPHRAARILEKEMRAGRVKRTRKNLEKLASMWFQARKYEKSRTALVEAARAEASAHSDQAEPYNRYMRRAIICFGEEKWQCAEDNLRRALKAYGQEQPCQARMLLAHVLLNKNNRTGAIAEFERAARSKACAADAAQWLRHLKEAQRLEEEQSETGDEDET